MSLIWKMIVKNIAREKKISAILVLQNYMLERFLERVSLSSYRNNFIIKGGFLIASMIGLDSRTTKDLDATIIGYPVSAESVQRMTEEILSVPVDDHISFSFKGIVAKEYEISKLRFWKQEYKYVGGAK